MKKFFINFIIFLIIIIILIFIGRYVYNFTKSDSKNTENSNSTNTSNIINNNEYTEEISTNIKQRGEFNTRGLFDLGNGISDYTTDLMANDMVYNAENALYHKIITNMQDYTKYKERIDLPNLTEKDFENIFLVVVSNENIRPDNEKDLLIYDVYATDDTTNIIMNQKSNPNLALTDQAQNNVFYAVVDKIQLRNSAKVIIEK